MLSINFTISSKNTVRATCFEKSGPVQILTRSAKLRALSGNTPEVPSHKALLESAVQQMRDPCLFIWASSKAGMLEQIESQLQRQSSLSSEAGLAFIKHDIAALMPGNSKDFGLLVRRSDATPEQQLRVIYDQLGLIAQRANADPQFAENLVHIRHPLLAVSKINTLVIQAAVEQVYGNKLILQRLVSQHLMTRSRSAELEVKLFKLLMLRDPASLLTILQCAAFLIDACVTEKMINIARSVYEHRGDFASSDHFRQAFNQHQMRFDLQLNSLLDEAYEQIPTAGAQEFSNQLEPDRFPDLSVNFCEKVIQMYAETMQ